MSARRLGAPQAHAKKALLAWVVVAIAYVAVVHPDWAESMVSQPTPPARAPVTSALVSDAIAVHERALASKTLTPEQQAKHRAAIRDIRRDFKTGSTTPAGVGSAK
jgi:hypothetical protein